MSEIITDLPEDLPEEPAEPAHRTELLSIPFLLGGDYIIKVFTSQSRLRHSLTMRLRNLRCRTVGLHAPFHGFRSPTDIAQYRFHAHQDCFSNGGFVTQPVHYGEVKFGAYIVTKYMPSSREFGNAAVAANFKDALLTLESLHNNGYVHGDLFRHIFITSTDQVLITDATGRHRQGYKEEAEAYDLAALAARFTPALGTWTVAEELTDRYAKETTKHITEALTVLEDEEGSHWSIEKLRYEIKSTLPDGA
jgi:hypothetical protein